MEYRIVIDQKIVDEYNQVYFKQYPRVRKPAIERPVLISMNKFMVMRRPQQNSTKQKYKFFGMWLCDKLGLSNLMLDSFEVNVAVYMPSRRRFDLDNLACGFKLLADSFTECGFIVDDNCNYLKKLTFTGGYSKENPRTEIIIKTIEEIKE